MFWNPYLFIFVFPFLFVDFSFLGHVDIRVADRLIWQGSSTYLRCNQCWHSLSNLCHCQNRHSLEEMYWWAKHVSTLPYIQSSSRLVSPYSPLLSILFFPSKRKHHTFQFDSSSKFPTVLFLHQSYLSFSFRDVSISLINYFSSFSYIVFFYLISFSVIHLA